MSPSCRCPPFDCRCRVHRTLTGDEVAAGELYQHFRRLIGAYVRAKLGEDRSSDWEDCEQEVWVHLWMKLERYPGEGQFCYWLRAVVGRCIIDFLRRRQNRFATEPL